MNAIRLSLVTAIVAFGLFVPQALAIDGGEVDTGNTYSNVGALVMFPPGYDPFPGGSGILIGPRVLLTAGHITDFLEQYPDVLPYCRVSFAAYALDSSTWLDIEGVVTHPNYQPAIDPDGLGANPHMNDVGVIILKRAVNTRKVPLATLPYAGFLDDLQAAGLLREPEQGGTPFTEVGYGTDAEFPPPEIIPRDGWRRFAQSEYLGFTQSWLFTLGCPATGNGATGYGDSGGPNFWVKDDGTLVLAALTSRGSWGTCIGWRVDIPETLDFIDWVIEEVKEGRL